MARRTIILAPDHAAAAAYCKANDLKVTSKDVIEGGTNRAFDQLEFGPDDVLVQIDGWRDRKDANAIQARLDHALAIAPTRPREIAL